MALVEQGFTDSREKAKRLVMAGQVYVAGQKCDKAGTTIRTTDAIEVRGGAMRYVSRGGLKLEKAMQVFGALPAGRVCMDIGASTGGFTDCMLQNGAVKVYAVDVGYGQLAWKLRSDERVVNLERTNIRYVTAEQVPDPIAFASVDVSFISLTLVLPAVRPLLTEDAQLVCLIKPQFEAGKGKVGKKGVVREPEIHREVVRRIVRFCEDEGFQVQGLDFSPVKGPEGNIEYLMLLQNGGMRTAIEESAFDAVVKASHAALDKKEA